MPRKAGQMDTLPPVSAGAFIVSGIMYPVDVVRAICMATPGTGTVALMIIDESLWITSFGSGRFSNIRM